MRFRTVAVAVAVVALTTLAGCGDADDPEAAGTTSTTAPAATTTETTAARRPRALVVPTTVAPLRSTSTTAADPDSVALDELVVGECVDIADAETDAIEVGRARRRACDEPHGLQIFHVGSLDPDPEAPFPGDEAVLAGADQMCLDAFEPYVGIPYLDSSLEIAHLRPSEAVWIGGDRTVRCAVQHRDLEPLVGSVQGSGR